MKKFLTLIFAVTLFSLLTACDGETVSTGNSTDNILTTVDISDSDSNNDSIRIEDIDWRVEEDLIDGQKVITFGYTNNTEYTIGDVEMKFTQKEGVTAEQRTVFNELKEKRSWSDEDIAKIYILGYNRKFADPGETVGEVPCAINGTYTLVEDIEQYQLMEPSTVSITYIDEDKMCMISYDFKTQKYSSVKEEKNIQQWSESEISNLLPKVEARAVRVSSDENNKFVFYAYGFSKEKYVSYVELCKEKGFTDVAFNSDTSFRASNSNGYEVNIKYNVTDEEMSVRIEIDAK